MMTVTQAMYAVMVPVYQSAKKDNQPGSVIPALAMTTSASDVMMNSVIAQTTRRGHIMETKFDTALEVATVYNRMRLNVG